MRTALVLFGVSVTVLAAPAAARATVPDWSDPVEVAHGYGHSVGIDAGGDVTVAWSTREPGEAFVAVRGAGANRFGPPLSLGGPGATSPQLAVGDSGAAVVAWIERSTPCGGIPVDCAYRLGIRTRPAGAATFGRATYVSEDAVAAPAVAINEAGEAVVAWPARDGAIVAVLGSAGAGVGAPAVLRAGTGPSFGPFPAAAIGERGAAVVSWGTFGAPPMASYSPAGGGFGPAEAIVPMESNGHTTAVVDARGTATVAVLTNERARVRVATRPPGGDFREVGPFAADRVGGLGLDLDASGDELLYWTQQTSPEQDSPVRMQAFASFRDAGEAWGDPIAVFRPNSYPDLRLDRRGNAHALWTAGASDDLRLMGATLTRFGFLERPQQLTRVNAQVGDLEVNRSGAAAGLFTVFVGTRELPDSVVYLVARAADERPAAVRLAVSVGATAARIRASCDEPCRLRARIGGQRTAAATRRRAVVTLRANRRGVLRVPLSRGARERLSSDRTVRLLLRAADGAGNVRRIARRLAR